MSSNLRRQAVRHWLILLLLLPVAGAQQGPMAAVELSAAEPEPANGTGIVHLDVLLTVSGHLCTQPPTFTVPITASNDAGYPMRVEPAALSFAFGRDQALTGASESRTVAIVVGPAPPGSLANLTVSAAAPTGGCGAVDAQGDEATVALAWLDGAPPSGPQQLIPGPGLLWILLSIAAARQGASKKPASIS